jgi:hypothetical protein
MTTPTEHQQWDTVQDRVDHSLALVRVLRQLFWAWVNEHTLGTAYCMQGMNPLDLRLVTDLLTGELKQAEELLGHMEPLEEVHP